MNKKNLFLYLDETGNTGLNHFDETQPLFILGAAVADINLDIEIKNDLETLKNLLKVPELHGKKIGVDGLNKISRNLIQIIEKNNITFNFCLVEKRYHVAIMIFHLIYDPGINPAASNFGFMFRQLRMTLSYNFIRVIDDSILSDFWDATQKNNIDLFVTVLQNIKHKIATAYMDSRSKQLLTDAVQYTIEFPNEIFESMTFKKSVSSNISAFTAMLNTLHELHGGKDIVIPRVFHDEQKEFGHTIKEAFSIVSKVQIPTDFNSLMIDTKTSDLLKNATLSLVPSNASNGIQLIDLVLWGFKRMTYQFDHGINPALADLIFKKSHIGGNTFTFHEQSMLDGLKSIPMKELTTEDHERAKKLMAELEEKRWKSK